MKTLCKGKSKRVAFLAFLDFVFKKATDVTFYRVSSSCSTGVMVARALGNKNRVFCNSSYQTARIIYLVSVGQRKCYTPVSVTYEEYCQILNNL